MRTPLDPYMEIFQPTNMGLPYSLFVGIPYSYGLSEKQNTFYISTSYTYTYNMPAVFLSVFPIFYDNFAPYSLNHFYSLLPIANLTCKQ